MSWGKRECGRSGARGSVEGVGQEGVWKEWGKRECGRCGARGGVEGVVRARGGV